MKIAYLLDEWGLDWTRCFNFDETCLALSPTGTHGWWWWKGKDERAGFQRPSKQAVTVTLVTSAVKAKVAAQIIFHGATDKVIPQVVTEVWMSCSPNHWASTQTLQQNAKTPQKPFVVLMGWIGIIMIPTHCPNLPPLWKAC
eukprot:5654930-Amphidinium_carterae.4